MRDSDIEDATRRAVLKTVAGAAGIGAAGTASAHEKWGQDEEDEESGPAGENVAKHPNAGSRGELENTSFVGYHGLGDTGRPETGSPGENAESRFGKQPKDYQATYGAEAMDPHYGSVTEIRVHGDYAYVTFFSSDRPSPGRGMAIVDISEFNAAETESDVEAAELEVVGFLRNNNVPTAAMDVKVSDDGQYAFISTQPYTLLFGSIAGNTDDPTRAEGMDPMPNVEDSGFTYSPGGVIAVDVSDKTNPRTVDSFQLEGSGSHNGFYKRIGGEEYVFAINDSGNLTADTGSGMFVLRFDREAGSLELVNRWYLETNLAAGEVTTENAAGEPYIHDMEIQNDPKTGTPVCYLCYWDRGMWALDVSDPTDIEALGNFQMEACHFASPAPVTVDGKRVAVASQEIGATETQTGRVYLVDCDGLFESEDRYYEVPRTVDDVALLGELDVWYWSAEWETPGEDSIEFGPYDFSLSPHNSDFTTDANGDLWVHQSHYSGGIRFLKVDPGTDDGLVRPAERFECNRESDSGGDCAGHDYTGADGPHNDTDWALTEEAWARPNLEPPKDSRMEGLNYLTPFCWGANVSNGVTFAGDINQGVYALQADGVPVGGAPAVSEVTREDDGSVFTAGQTNQVEITVESVAYHDSLRVRDRVPDGWEVVEGDDYEVVEIGGSTYLDFGEVEEGQTVNYFVDVGDETASYDAGPTQVSADGGDIWTTAAGTTDTSFVAGQSTNLAAGGLAVGTAGALSSKRDAVTERLSELRSGED